MEIKHLLNKLATPATFVLIGAAARVIPHPANFAPIGAMALFGGAYMNKKQALILPILAMILSDFIIGFDSIPMRLTVYGSFFLIVLLGMFLKKRVSIKNTILFSLTASILFFTTTNFAVWAAGGLYPHTVTGLTESYFLAIPFFRNTIFGDLFYTGVFFGGYEFVKKLAFNTSPLWAWRRRA
jgi:hypothetical protein